MTEPITTTGATTLVATVSAFTLTFLGVEYIALIWALVGALVVLGQVEMRRWKAVGFVVLSTLVGAALGHGLLMVFDSDKRALLIVGSVVGGFGSQALLASLLARANNTIFGNKNA